MYRFYHIRRDLRRSRFNTRRHRRRMKNNWSETARKSSSRLLRPHPIFHAVDVCKRPSHSRNSSSFISQSISISYCCSEYSSVPSTIVPGFPSLSFRTFRCTESIRSCSRPRQHAPSSNFSVFLFTAFVLRFANRHFQYAYFFSSVFFFFSVADGIREVDSRPPRSARWRRR